MTPFKITHELRGDRDAYWKIFFDKEFTGEMYDRIGVKEWKILAWKEEDGKLYREVKVVPKRDLPSMIKKVVKGDLGYIEHSTLYWDRDFMECNVKPTLLSEKTTVKATYKLEKVGEGRLRRTFEGTIEVKIPLLGSKVEKLVVDDMTRSYDVAAKVHQEWLDRTK